MTSTAATPQPSSMAVSTSNAITTLYVYNPAELAPQIVDVTSS